MYHFLAGSVAMYTAYTMIQRKYNVVNQMHALEMVKLVGEVYLESLINT